ncbi:hypothetical protein MMC13_004851 [Lambiella insularis]|nr:hypothetical protein [Lambiella insularis]
MDPSLFRSLSVVAILITALLAPLAASWEFDVPCLQTFQPSDPTANATVTFTLIDVHDKNTSTLCTTSFADPTANSTNYPTSPLPCAKPEFAWYFASFSGLGNFSINIVHTYVDPAVGPVAETLYGTGNPVNEEAVPALNCYVLQTGAYGCAFESTTAPIVIPVTSASAKRRSFEQPRRGRRAFES